MSTHHRNDISEQDRPHLSVLPQTSTGCRHQSPWRLTLADRRAAGLDDFERRFDLIGSEALSASASRTHITQIMEATQ
jgi:hypothetical protein